jgi:hypothetical protein
VCRADEITIGSLKVTGSRALVLLAYKSVVVQTVLDVSGDTGVDGPGGSYIYSAGASSPNGGVGGSFATTGGGANSNGAVASAPYGEPALVPLLGGMRGQPSHGPGGGAGGALQITAGERVDVLGVINAGGGGGRYGSPGYGTSGAGGGGSGGGILVEAPTVVISGTAVANGGGGGGAGGGGGSQGPGTSGAGGGEVGLPIDPMVQAWGGSGEDGHGCPLYGYVYGGDGGYGGIGTTPATNGQTSGYDSRCLDTSYVGGGGGGGGVGRIRVNTISGCQCGGKISPQPTFGMLVKQ